MQHPIHVASRRPGLLALSVAAVAALAAGCGKKDEAPPPKAPPPPQVGYLTIRPEPVTLTTELPGRTTAFRVAEVRPQVGGVIQKRLFVEGTQVKAGQQLYQIDAAPYQASLNSAAAAQKKAEATVTSSRLLAQRYQPLVEARAVSRQEYDNAVASQGTAEADVASAKAGVEAARINLRYTRVTSPISGRTGRSSVTEGALVTASQATSMVTVQQLDPIYVDVTQPSAVLLRLKREMATGQLRKSGDGAALVRLKLEDGTDYAEPGRLRFAEVTVDPGTGSVTLRAEFPNPAGTLLPGMFVHQRIEEGVDDNGILVPQRSVTRDQRGEPQALVVGADGKAEMRKIKTDRAIGDRWLVTSGLKAGDKLIVDGAGAAKPNQPVTAREISAADAAKPAASGPPAGAGGPGAGASGAQPGGPAAGASSGAGATTASR